MLTQAAVKAARTKPSAYKKYDGDGLFLYVAPTGLRSYRVKYQADGRERLVTVGSHPDMTLDEARAARDRVKAARARGIEPLRQAQRRAAVVKAAEDKTFGAVGRAWHDHRRQRWTPVHAREVLDSLERDVFPAIGATPIADLDPPRILDVLRAIEARGAIETARRVRQRISKVFGYAIARRLVTADPAAELVDEMSGARPVARHPALTDVDELRQLLALADRIRVAPAIALASRFLALTGVRLAAVRGAQWDEIEGVDWTGAAIGPGLPLWRVPAARMKMKLAQKSDADRDHLVPLSRQAVDVLRAARSIGGGGAGLIFAGRAAGGMIGEDAIGALYDRAGFTGQHVPHGWRAAFSTALNERWPDDRQHIDTALAHSAMGKVEAAYNRARHMAKRRLLLQRWADLIVDG